MRHSFELYKGSCSTYKNKELRKGYDKLMFARNNLPHFARCLHYSLNVRGGKMDHYDNKKGRRRFIIKPLNL